MYQQASSFSGSSQGCGVDKVRCKKLGNKPEVSLLDGAGGGADWEDFVGGLEEPPKKPLEGAEGLGAGLARRALPPTR